MPSVLRHVEDPIEKEYDVYISSLPSFTAPHSGFNTQSNPISVEESSASSSIYLLQHPTRSRRKPANARNGCCPTATRIKPKSGFLELDVPICPDFNYNRDKASRWGRALKESGGSAGVAGGTVGAGNTSGNGVFGMANGFIGPDTFGRGRLQLGASKKQGERNQAERDGTMGVDGAKGAAQDADNVDEEEEPPQMECQVMGGKIMKSGEGSPLYMVGVYRGNELHLTPMTGLVQLRSQFHHLDAQSYMNRLAPVRQSVAANSANASSGTATSIQPQPAPKMVHLSHHRPSALMDFDSGRTLENDTKELLGRAAGEKWVECRYWDEDEELSYESYNERLFLGGGEKQGDVAELKRGEELLAEWSKGGYLNKISRGRAPSLPASTVFKQRRPTAKAKGKGRASQDSRVEISADV